jgi:predicted phosphodiesterase
MTKKYVFISDTHGKHEYLTSNRMGNILGSGDCLIHAGDISNVGKVHEIKDSLRGTMILVLNLFKTSLLNIRRREFIIFLIVRWSLMV